MGQRRKEQAPKKKKQGIQNPFEVIGGENH
jgi:hypothetical protein